MKQKVNNPEEEKKRKKETEQIRHRQKQLIQTKSKYITYYINVSKLKFQLKTE